MPPPSINPLPLPALPLNGGCRCGQVRFTVSAPPMITMACHCTGCQRMTGGPYSLSVLVPSAGFAVTQGEPVIGGLHGDTRHFHCPRCLSWMFTRPPGPEMFVNVRTPLLDDPADFPPFMETGVDEKLPWVTTPAVRSFGMFPENEAFPDLLKAYAERDAP